MANHRYWHMTFTADSQGLGGVSLAEIEFRALIGGPDSTGAGVAIAAVGVPANAFDNSNATEWVMSIFDSFPQRVTYDFGAGNAVTIEEAAITAGAGTISAPFDFFISYSDDNTNLTTVVTIGGETGWSANEQRLYLTGESGAGTVTVKSTKQMPWRIFALIDKRVSLPWQVLLASYVKSQWKNATTIKKIGLSWGVLAPVRQRVAAPFALTTKAENKTFLKWRVVNVDSVANAVKASWSLRTDPAALTLPLDRTLTLKTGELIEFNSATLQLDESSWGWRISLTFSDASGWQKLRPLSGPVAMSLTVRGTVFNLISEGAGRNRSGNSTNYTIKGRSITAKMAKGNADQVTKTWLSTTSKTIAQELCDANGIVLDWQSVDWTISRLEMSSRYPIDIIKKLATSVGSVVQTTPVGVLTVRPKYLIAPSIYNSVIPDHVLSDVDDFATLSETWEARPNYDNIEVGNEAVSRFPAINLSTSATSGGVLIKATVVPFQIIALTHTALSNMNIQYLGVVTETLTQTVEIVEGKGRLSKPFYGLLNHVYRHVNLGAISITEAGSITTTIGLHTLVDITYQTKRHEWKATSMEDEVQLIIEDLL